MAFVFLVLDGKTPLFIKIIMFNKNCYFIQVLLLFTVGMFFLLHHLIEVGDSFTHFPFFKTYTEKENNKVACGAVGVVVGTLALQ